MGEYEVLKRSLRTLSPHLLYQRLCPLQAKWYSIGISFYIPFGDLNAIAQNHGRDCDRCLGAVLEKWTAMKCDASWENVIEMLTSNSLKEVRLAKEIKAEFEVCQESDYNYILKTLYSHDVTIVSN